MIDRTKDVATIAAYIIVLAFIFLIFYKYGSRDNKPKYTIDQLECYGIETIHDSKRNVTCYKSHDGLSCIKD